MPLSRQHRHAVLLADRTRDVRTITTVVAEVLAATRKRPSSISRPRFAPPPGLVANRTKAGFEIVLGMPVTLSGG